MRFESILLHGIVYFGDTVGCSNSLSVGVRGDLTPRRPNQRTFVEPVRHFQELIDT